MWDFLSPISRLWDSDGLAGGERVREMEKKGGSVGAKTQNLRTAVDRASAKV